MLACPSTYWSASICAGERYGPVIVNAVSKLTGGA
jgi:hypothetical protein